MSDLVPAGGATAVAANASAPTLMGTLTDSAGGSMLTRLGAVARQPAVRKALPAFVGVAAVGMAALAWAALSPSPQRTLYQQLDDSDRASVVGALDAAGIDYRIDNTTGALTVAEQDFYKARMLVASDGAVATPETGDQMLETLPMGASRTLEGERLRGARERDLELTIGEIDGVESVRVHLAEAERSAFVRENTPPSASIMLRLVRGRQLSDGQVSAIVNLVAASVPGLAIDRVRVVDQHGRLLSDPSAQADDRLEMQARMEEKLRRQVSSLLTPMLGAENFSSEIQVDLDMEEVTRAREAYDKDGVVRSETQAQSQSAQQQPAAGVPGALANTPPLPAQAQQGAPQGTAAAPAGQVPPVNGESSSSRTYELGREVSVSTAAPGTLRRVSVAVAISKEAMKGAKPQDIADLEALVSAAVGANPQRGDMVKVVTRSFEPVAEGPPPFYETGWFAMLVRNGAAVLAVLLVLMIGVRPMVKAVRGEKPAKAKKGKKAKGAAEADNDETGPETIDGGQLTTEPQPAANRAAIPGSPVDDEEAVSRAELLSRQMSVAQALVAERPEAAVTALRQMLSAPTPEAEAA